MSSCCACCRRRLSMLVMMRCITCAVVACPDAAAAGNKRVSPNSSLQVFTASTTPSVKITQPVARIQRHDSFAPAQAKSANLPQCLGCGR